MTTKWGGSHTRKARAHFAPLVAAGGVVCPRCGLPVLPEHRWHVGHQVDRALGGTGDLSNLWPEHGRCNEQAGGRLAQAMNRRPAPPKVKRRAW